MKNYDLVIVGGGPAGLSAAVKAYDKGIKNILVVERDEVLGGILNQCIHNGFGLHRFGEELTGPEYAQRFIDEVLKRDIDVLLDTIVMDISPQKEVTMMNEKNGIFTVKPEAVILAMGCRERPRGALNIPGSRPSGVYSAGTAQRMVNLEGYMPGKKVVILGSGDIGLIMARRMTLEGAKVQCVAEIMPYSGGLKRNIVQCLDDYDIPLFFSTTVSKIEGKDKITGVYLSKVDENMKIIPGTETYYECDTLLLSVGLIPENELSKSAGVEIDRKTKGSIVSDRLMTSVEGIFACGNVLHVHDLVDYVSEEAEIAAENAVEYINGNLLESKTEEVEIKAGNGISYTMPQFIHYDTMPEKLTVRFRVNNVYPKRRVSLYADGNLVKKRNKRVLAPGEMENFELKKSDLSPEVSNIEIKLEEI